MERIKNAALIILAAALIAGGAWVGNLYLNISAGDAELEETRAEVSALEEKVRELESRPEPEPETEPEPEPPKEPVQKAPPAGAPTGREILEAHRVVAHALGPSEDWQGRNCVEGFEKAYENGTRVFEADIIFTADGELVLRHDWGASIGEGDKPGDVLTLEEYESFNPILGKYTAMTFRDLLELMDRYQDIVVVTDTKHTDPEVVSVQFTKLRNDAEESGLLYLFDRIYIQLYNRRMYDALERIDHFPHYILTLYASGFNNTMEQFQDYALFCNENGIEGITMWNYWWRPEYKEVLEMFELLSWVHTVDDEKEARSLLEQGVTGVYTNSLTEPQLAPESEPEPETGTETEAETEFEEQI